MKTMAQDNPALMTNSPYPREPGPDSSCLPR
jgi:hypothetical protein